MLPRSRARLNVQQQQVSKLLHAAVAIRTLRTAWAARTVPWWSILSIFTASRSRQAAKRQPLGRASVLEISRWRCTITGSRRWRTVCPVASSVLLTLTCVRVGTCPYVGTGGHLGCGGFGFPSRLWGLALDAVTSAQVVLANGTIVTASASQNQDVFFVSSFSISLYIVN